MENPHVLLCGVPQLLVQTKEDQINGEIVMEEAKEGQMNGAIVIEEVCGYDKGRMKQDCLQTITLCLNTWSMTSPASPWSRVSSSLNHRSGSPRFCYGMWTYLDTLNLLQIIKHKMIYIITLF